MQMMALVGLIVAGLTGIILGLRDTSLDRYVDEAQKAVFKGRR